MQPLEIQLAPDALEANDAIGLASELGGMTSSVMRSGLSLHSSTDEDWFTFRLPQTGTAADSVTVMCADGAGNVGILLFDANQQLVDTSSYTTDGVGNISFEGRTSGYYIQVVDFDGSIGTYDLVLDAVSRSGVNLAAESISAPPDVIRHCLFRQREDHQLWRSNCAAVRCSA